MSEVVDTTRLPVAAHLYRDYTGARYEIRAIATHSVTKELMVIYRDWPTANGAWHATPLDDFLDTVEIPADDVPGFMMDHARFEGDRAFVPRFLRRIP